MQLRVSPYANANASGIVMHVTSVETQTLFQIDFARAGVLN